MHECTLVNMHVQTENHILLCTYCSIHTYVMLTHAQEYEHMHMFTHINTHVHAHSNNHMDHFVFSHTHSDADVEGTIATLQTGSPLFQLEEMEHMSQAL